MMSEMFDVNDPKRVVAEGYNRVALSYARLEVGTEWPRMRWLRKVLEWLGVPMYFSCYDPETVKRMIGEAGFELLETAVEEQVEGGNEIPYLWLLAQKPGGSTS